MCLNGTYPFLSATLVRQLPYYLFRETCFMDSYPQKPDFCIYFGSSIMIITRISKKPKLNAENIPM